MIKLLYSIINPYNHHTQTHTLAIGHREQSYCFLVHILGETIALPVINKKGYGPTHQV